MIDFTCHYIAVACGKRQCLGTVVFIDVIYFPSVECVLKLERCLDIAI